MNVIKKYAIRHITKIPTLFFTSFNNKPITSFNHYHLFRQIYNKQNLISRLTYNFASEGEGGPKLTKQQRFKKQTEDMLKQSPQDQQNATSYVKSQNKVTKILILVTLMGLIAGYIWFVQKTKRLEKELDKSISGITKISTSGKIKIGGQWQLINTKGKRFGSKDLQGTYYLIYFGFTNCPDVCPNSLIKISKVLKKLRKMPQYQYINLKVVFVSVDPQRDTPQKIQKFLSFFDPSIIGVTGKSNKDEQLKDCMNKFKIYAQRIEFKEDDPNKRGSKDYTIDHTVLTYLMSDDNQFLTHLAPNLDENQILKAVIQKILLNENVKMKTLKAI